MTKRERGEVSMAVMPYSTTYLDRLAVKMFRKFARMEYALKAASFHRGEGDAQPDWKGFFRSVKSVFQEPMPANVREALTFIKNEPPKKQVIQRGQLAWDERTPGNVPDDELIAVYVCRVRNNLFHGGKFNGRWFDPPRSGPLLRHSLTILDACLNASPEVKRAYDGW